MTEIIRPNGKVYRARKAPWAEVFLSYEGEGVVVLGTHDIALARQVAAPELNDFDYTEEFEPTLDWWRRVPWDAFGVGCARSWITDETRGTACVVWQP